MKRTKKMMLVTLMATTAITMLLMSRAFAAPAPAGTCGATTGTNSKTCTTSDLIQQVLGNGASIPGCGTLTLKPGTYPTAADLKGILAKIKPSACTGADCTVKPSATPAPKATAPAATATPAPAPTATPAPVSGSMSAEESKMINLVNQERTAAGLKALTFDSTLRTPALKHSQDMSQNNFFSHTSPTYGTFSQRLKASGVKYTAAGENLAMYGSVEKAHVGLMNSEGHRANIMNPNYTRIGIGIVYNQSRGTYYITQWFAR